MIGERYDENYRSKVRKRMIGERLVELLGKG